jgi:uncharacterized protein (UPF0305 family)
MRDRNRQGARVRLYGSTLKVEYRASSTIEQRYRNWKVTDIARAEQMARHLPRYNTEQYTEESLEAYTTELTVSIQEIIEATTPWKRSSDRTERWWTPEVDAAVRIARTTR